MTVAPFLLTLTDSIDGGDSQSEIGRYKPGQAFRARVQVTQLGVLADLPNALVGTAHWPDGTTTTLTVAHPGVGDYFADIAVPLGMQTTVAWYRFRTTGATVEENALAERRFVIDLLNF